MEQPQVKKTWKPVAAGILDIVGGFSVMGWLLSMNIFLVFLSQLGDKPYNPLDLGPVALAIGGITAAIAILAIAGGILAIRRKRWRLALAGATAAFLLSLIKDVIPLIVVFSAHTQISGPQIPSSSVAQLIVPSLPYVFLGIAAIVLTAMSKSEFE